MATDKSIDKILIVGITPYFLEKGTLWFEQNLEKILKASKTQSFFEDNILFLEKKQYYNFSQLLRKLDELGYEKVIQIQEPGELSQRGGIIDVFPINLNQAVRLEFFGNTIDNIEILDIKTADEKTAKEVLKKRLKSQKLFSDLKGLKSGDYLVHLDHGVGKFIRYHISYDRGKNGINYYLLKYAHGDRLYVPVGLERKLSRYIGFIEPKVSRLGSPLWQRVKRKIKEEAEKFAREILEIYAKKEIATRPPYLQEDEINLQLASSFQFRETPDQWQAIEDIKKDLESSKPMDRIVCGDVGFGKTEVALRAMIKVVNSGYQAALLCPTTILASQHFQNFKERLKDLPVKVELLSRLQSKRQQQQIVKDLERQKIDIIVGTHRILSKDVANYCSEGKLGLLVIDDEQRFGVRQKEKLKKLRASLDVLSLSATPIPRTLYLALSSLKNISLIQIPPAGRLPVKTFILPWNKKIIQESIKKELSRGGQIYYLHNRVETIGAIKNFLENLVPEARIDTVHGRMKEKEIVKVMNRFSGYSDGRIRISRGRKAEQALFGCDVLVATTIIGSGLDLPNVNTLIVADAARLGLAEAYQIRGRVGRSDIQSFAYFLHPPKFSDEKFKRASGKKLSEKIYPPKFSEGKFARAKMRLDALKEAQELGSGYRIALRDLEIRGAGNILGKEQSGNINRVGLNLYCQMLAEEIEKLKQKC